MASKVSVNLLLYRSAAIEREAMQQLTAPVACEAFPRWFVKCETFPYWKNRLIGMQTVEGYADDYGEEMSLYRYTVGARLVVAHVTSEYEGELSDAVDLMIPEVVEYLDARELLQSAYVDAAHSLNFTTPMPYLIRAHVTAATGFTQFPPNASGTSQCGADFQWECDFNKQLVQAYLG